VAGRARGRPLRWQFERDARDAAEVEAMIATYRAYNRAPPR
jgi:hypothetical protein